MLLQLTIVWRRLYSLLYMKSPCLAGHSHRVAQLSVEIGAALGLDTHLLGVLFKGALLHDIGKMLIPREVLFKKGALTPTERQEIQSHPSLGVQILDGVPGFEEIREIVLGHHEKIDGSG